MSDVSLICDVVDSQGIKARYTQTTAINKIRSALERAQESLCRVDPDLGRNGPYRGDSFLLIGGSNPVEILRAAVLHQAEFVAWHYTRLAIKIAIGYVEYETRIESNGEKSIHGKDIDDLNGISEFCPDGGVVVNRAMYVLLFDAGFGDRFIECTEKLKTGVTITYYEDKGDYKIPSDRRQRAERRALVIPEIIPAVVIPAVTHKQHDDIIGFNLDRASTRLWLLVLVAALSGGVTYWLR